MARTAFPASSSVRTLCCDRAGGRVALRRKSGDIEIPAGPPALRCKLDKAALKGDQGVSGPLKCLVTGCAGFIGSHTAEKLLEEGCRVVGVDDFDHYYPRRVKLANLSDLLNSPGFKFVEGDLCKLPLRNLLRDVEAIVHLAGQPGVRASWGNTFSRYARNNVLATQMLLEQACMSPLRVFVYASSSSVYGAAKRFPTSEDHPKVPISPYGITKLCAEQLCFAYQERLRAPIVRLRYFSVYGPRQRPDMVMHKMIKDVLSDGTLDVFGDGSQTRDFTYVQDIVEANWLAVSHPSEDADMNIAGGDPVSINHAIELVEDIAGKELHVRHLPQEIGDPLNTHASTVRAKRLIGFKAKTRLRDGLLRQFEWQQHSGVSSAREKRRHFSPIEDGMGAKHQRSN